MNKDIFSDVGVWLCSDRMIFYLMHTRKGALVQMCLHHDITALKMISFGGVRSLEFWFNKNLSC
jgi:hypothetical protein